jgi:hypothetical protein
MRFKEWLLSEMAQIFLKEPTPITVWMDASGTTKQTFVADFIDVRWEDWKSDPTKPIFHMDGGAKLQGNVVAPLSVNQTFSAPLADGRFINFHSPQNQTIDRTSAYQVIRKDWARFAEFINGNRVVKNPLHLRPYDAGMQTPSLTGG